MLRITANLICIVLTLPSCSFACECINFQRTCQYLQGADTVFVGEVLATVPAMHIMEKGKSEYSSGYSMRFRVEQSMQGDAGKEITVETGNGGGDCGTPLPVGKKYFIFAYKNSTDGKLWTGMCSGNWQLDGDPTDAKRIAAYRDLIATHTGTIFGEIISSKPVWREDDVVDGKHEPMAGMLVHANSEKFSTVTRSAKDGSFEFQGLPGGKYTIMPEQGVSLDFDHEYDDRYQVEVRDGACASVDFDLQPTTRIKGRVKLPISGSKLSVEVEAIPTSLHKLNQFSGKTDFIDDGGKFDLWPLPPGDYYVGVNINSSPKADSPFPPTYYPGVLKQSTAQVVHVANGEVKELELNVPELAKPRPVHFVATGLDGKPLKTIYIQLEDLRHPGDAASYVNVDLDKNGAGSMNIYAGYAYHLHASHWAGNTDWCAKPVSIPAGIEPVEARFEMDYADRSCDIYEIDHIAR